MNPKDQITQALAQSGPVSDELIQLMFQHIGDLDPDLRDETIYLGWLKLLMEKRWTTAQKQWLTPIQEQTIIQTSLAYMRQEKDNRGLVAEKSFCPRC